MHISLDDSCTEVIFKVLTCLESNGNKVNDFIDRISIMQATSRITVNQH